MGDDRSISKRNTDLQAELLFLITKHLESLGLSEAASSLRNSIDDKKLLPSRINIVGEQFGNSFANFEQVHNYLNNSTLWELCSSILSSSRSHHGLSRLALNSSLFGLVKQFCSPCLRANLYPFPPHNSPHFRLDNLVESWHNRIDVTQHTLAHRNAIYCLQMDQRGEYVFTGSDDFTIKIWSVNPTVDKCCRLRHTLRGHVAEIIELAVSADNHLLASVDSNWRLVIWCLRTGQPVVAVRGSSENNIISGMAFLNPVTNNYTESDGYAHGESPFARGWLAVISYGGFLHLIPYKHQVYDNTTNLAPDRWTCCKVTLSPTVKFTTYTRTNTSETLPAVVCMDVSPGALLLAAGCADQSIRLYNLVNPQKPELSVVLRAHEGRINSLAFSHYGLKLASGSSEGEGCRLWRFQAGTWRSLQLQFRKRVKCRPCLVAWSVKDRYLIVSLKNGTIYVFSGQTGQLFTIIDGHEGAVHAVAPSPLDDNILATGGTDGRFQIWHLARHHQESHRQRPMNGGTEQENISRAPLLYHYRYPSCNFDPDYGLLWFSLEPDNHIPFRPSSSTRQVASGRTEVLGNGGSSSLTRLTPRDFTRTMIGSAPYPIKHQHLTACRALAVCDSVGYLVVTKSGLLSTFQTSNLRSPGCARAPLDLNSPPYTGDEQFLHWEVDTAELNELDPDPNDSESEIASTALSRSPPSTSMFNYISSFGITRPPVILQTPNTDETTEPYRRPPAVRFEVIHSASQVPFHRLPPAYMTTLLGQPLVPEEQRTVPGRSQFTRDIDLMPSVTDDVDLNVEAVVDDIQFCANVPTDYCPTPIGQPPVEPVSGKQYLWMSHWLSNAEQLIEPLRLDELYHRAQQQFLRYRDEHTFFVGQGDPRITFGDEFSSQEAALMIEPQSTSALFLTQAMDDRNDTDLVENVQHRNRSQIRPQPPVIPPILIDVSNTTISSEPETANMIPPSGSPFEEPFEADTSSEESEWSAHDDVSLGWWTRQKRKKRRRDAGRHGATQATGEDSTSSSRPVPPITERPTSGVIGTSARCRRSIRQQRRRLFAKIKRVAELRSERKRKQVRRSKRFQRLFSSPLHRPTNRRSVVRRRSTQSTSDANSYPQMSTPWQLIDDDYIGERRERLKQRLVLSLDCATRRSNSRQLSTTPANGYMNPDCDGPCYPSIGLTIDSHPLLWNGPHFDWLSTYHPVPTPYIPQLGDRVVYITQGHRQYVQCAWNGETDWIPSSVTDCTCTPDFYEHLHDADSHVVDHSNQLPWEQWEQIPAYVCGTVCEINYAIRRLSKTPAPLHRSSKQYRGKSRRTPAKPPTQTVESAPHEPPVNTDTFVRLVKLRLVLDEFQAYRHLGHVPPPGQSSSLCQTPASIDIVYHDVDGILDFLILRRLFDLAINRSWTSGQIFICPVGSVWWPGKIVDPPNTSFNQVPSCSTSSAVSTCDDPWLSIRVQWLQSVKSNTCPDPAFDQLEDNGDCLSPWDIHPWVALSVNLPDSSLPLSSDGTIHGIENAGLVQVSPYQLGYLYGSVGDKDEEQSENSLSAILASILSGLRVIKDLPISQHFRSPVDLAAFPDYLFVNPYLIDLSLIEARLQTNFYRHLDSVRSDFHQLLENTIRYNIPDSDIVQNARLVYQLCLHCVGNPHQTDAASIEHEYQRLLACSPCASTASTILLPSSPIHAQVTTSSPHLPCDDSSNGSTRHLRSGNRNPPSINIQPSLPSSLSNSGSYEAFCSCEWTKRDPDSWVPRSLELIQSLMANPRSMFFREPINMKIYPDYRHIVTHPTDLTKIRNYLQNTLSSRLLKRSRSSLSTIFHCPHQCLTELGRIVSNSKCYNTDPETAVFDDTVWLEEWIETVFIPQAIVGVAMDEKHPPSPRLEKSKSQSRIRQSQLTCRKLSLRDSSGEGILSTTPDLHKGPDYLPSKEVFNSTNPLDHKPQCTSSGRVVRRPLRDSYPTFTTSDSESDNVTHTEVSHQDESSTNTGQHRATRSSSDRSRTKWRTNSKYGRKIAIPRSPKYPPSKEAPDSPDFRDHKPQCTSSGRIVRQPIRDFYPTFTTSESSESDSVNHGEVLDRNEPRADLSTGQDRTTKSSSGRIHSNRTTYSKYGRKLTLPRKL